MKRNYTLVGTRPRGRFMYENGVAVGSEHAIVAVEVDIDELALRLGIRAMGNKSGTAILGGGAVRVRVTSRLGKVRP